MQMHRDTVRSAHLNVRHAMSTDASLVVLAAVTLDFSARILLHRFLRRSVPFAFAVITAGAALAVVLLFLGRWSISTRVFRW